MLSFLLPGELKRQLDAALIAFIDRQTAMILPEPVREKIRRLSSQLMVQKALDDAVLRAVTRFTQEYPDIDEDLAESVLAVPDFSDNTEVRQALLTLVSILAHHAPRSVSRSSRISMPSSQSGATGSAWIVRYRICCGWWLKRSGAYRARERFVRLRCSRCSG
jgi:hypothetical protein